MSGSTYTTQSLTDILYPSFTNHSPFSTVTVRKQLQEHKHRKSHHTSAAANSSVTSMFNWGLGKVHELGGKGE
jgi:hypothetical protein